MPKTVMIIAALAAGLLATTVAAAPPLNQGAVVRVRAGSIEDGWHRGRMHVDAQRCWMVKLDRPTREQYTMLALIVVNRLELANGGEWKPVDLTSVLQAQPKVCREYAND